MNFRKDTNIQPITERFCIWRKTTTYKNVFMHHIKGFMIMICLLTSVIYLDHLDRLVSAVSPLNYSYFISPSEKAMAPHSSTLAWETPWMEEPGRLQSMGLLSQT